MSLNLAGSILLDSTFNVQLRSKMHTALNVPLGLHHTRIGKYTTKKFGINGHWGNKHFFIVIHRFSLVKAAINALCVGKLHKNCLSNIDLCTMMISKNLNFSSA